MEYKGYTAKITFDEKALIWHGEVAGIMDVVTFQASDAKGFVKEFHDSVDDYLEFCAEEGTEPEKPYSGNFTVRTDAELHRQLALAAAAQGVSINHWVVSAMRQQLVNEANTAHPVKAAKRA